MEKIFHVRPKLLARYVTYSVSTNKLILYFQVYIFFGAHFLSTYVFVSRITSEAWVVLGGNLFFYHLRFEWLGAVIIKRLIREKTKFRYTCA